MESQHPVLEKLWEDRYFVALNIVKFSMAALFIAQLYGLTHDLNEMHCRYALKFTTAPGQILQ